MNPAVSPLSIGSVRLPVNIVLAPLAGFTDYAYRRIAEESGVGLAVTEMVSVNGLKYGGEGSKALLFDGERKIPCAVQLFGSDPEVFAEVLEKCEELKSFEIVDINMGCPMPKVTKTGAGSALLADPERAADIVRACRERTKKTVTVKMRLGVSEKSGAEKFAEKMQSAGVAAITVHGRTARQLYGGKADWESIERVKKAVAVPVIGNGDVTSASEFTERAKKYGVDGIAVGRGGLGGCFIASELLGLAPKNRYEVALRHIELMLRTFDARYALLKFRAHSAYYFKGIKGGKELRKRIIEESDADKVCAILRGEI